MKLLKSTKNEMTKMVITKLLKQYQSTVLLLTKLSNKFQETYKLLDQLLDISPKNVILLKALNSELSYVEAWFADKNSKSLGI